MVIEHFNPRSWLAELKQRYDLSKSILRESPESFTVLISPSGNKTIIVGRFDRTRAYGVVLDGRVKDVPVEYERRCK